MPITLPVSLAVVAAFATSTYGCKSSPETAPSPAPVVSPAMDAPAATPVQITRLLTLNASGFTEPAELVVRDAEALTSAWRTLHNGIPGNPAPAIDFSRNVVLLLALGGRNTGGYVIQADSVNAAGGNSTVYYTVTSPGPKCATIQMITSPVDVISIPRPTGEVRFSRRSVVASC